MVAFVGIVFRLFLIVPYNYDLYKLLKKIFIRYVGIVEKCDNILILFIFLRSILLNKPA